MPVAKAKPQKDRSSKVEREIKADAAKVAKPKKQPAPAGPVAAIEFKELPVPPLANGGTTGLVSGSGRTKLTATMQADGSFAVLVVRDNRTMHDFSAGYEQPGVDGTPYGA